MKKVIFSAMALLAFTATSFAAEGKKEVKKVKILSKKNQIKVIRSASDCARWARRAEALALEEEYNTADAKEAKWELYWSCMRDVTFN